MKRDNWTNNRPTLQTDAVTMQPVDRLARAYTFHGTEPLKYSTKELVPAEFARELERDRDELKEQVMINKGMKSKFNDVLNGILNESHVEMSDGAFLDNITRKLREIGNTIADSFPEEARYLISLDSELGPLKDKLGRD